MAEILPLLTHRRPVDLRKWAIFNTILMSPKSWLSQEDLDAGCEHAQFLQWILKDDDVYFKKITAS